MNRVKSNTDTEQAVAPVLTDKMKFEIRTTVGIDDAIYQLENSSEG